jgi:hypothetical protein
VRQDGPVDALRAEHVDVVLHRELLGQERLGRATWAVSSIDHGGGAKRLL